MGVILELRLAQPLSSCLPQGEEVLQQLQALAPRGVKVRIAVSKPNGPLADLQSLLQSGKLATAGWAGLGLPKLAPDCRPR